MCITIALVRATIAIRALVAMILVVIVILHKHSKRQALSRARPSTSKVQPLPGPVWPPELSNNYTTNGQTIPVTTIANADTLAFIGSASNGSLSATATINYTDGSSQDFTLTMSDWTLGNGTLAVAQGDQIVTTFPYRNGTKGKDATKTYLFYTDVSLQPGKSVQSVKLPNAFSAGAMHIFAIGSRAVTQYNNVGINDDNNPGFSASLDGGCCSYSAEALQAQGLIPGQTFTYNGVDFTWPDTAGGQMDNYQANGQVIPITPVAGATTLAFLGAGTNGSPTGTATITFTDGTTQNFNLQLTDWATSSNRLRQPGRRNEFILSQWYEAGYW